MAQNETIASNNDFMASDYILLFFFFMKWICLFNLNHELNIFFMATIDFYAAQQKLVNRWFPKNCNKNALFFFFIFC